MKIDFPYGEKGISFEITDQMNVNVIRAKSEEIIENPKKAIIEATEKPLLTPPLRDILKNRPPGKICIVISDSTRPVPSGIIVQALIEIFEEEHIPDEDVQILIATGLHRKSTPEELKKILGKNILYRFDVINHVAEDESMVEYLGDSSYNTPIYINKHYLDAKIKILTGYVEPHFFAGFSGGRKSIVPGIAGAETIKANHSAQNIGSEQARFGILNDNPIYEDAIEIAKMNQIKPDFIINVCINNHHQITKIITGALQSHQELVQYQQKLCFHPIDELYDIVISGNGGAPLDLNLYQAVKSMAIGELGVKEGGTIITVNECRDGVGQPKFEELINLEIPAKQLYEEVTEGKIRCKDQWEIQALSRVLSKADIYVISEMEEHQLGKIGLKYANSVEEALNQIQEKLDYPPKILVLPDGPLILPQKK